MRQASRAFKERIAPTSFGWFLKSILTAPFQRPELLGIHKDGWLSPNSMVAISTALSGLELAINLIVPDCLPFKFRLWIQAVCHGEIISAVRADRPGPHRLLIPMIERGIVELSVDQWTSGLILPTSEASLVG
jgi:hypothetical protein